MSARFRSSNVVVITGASSGIGRSTALAFARKGARLVLAARKKEKLDSLARECAGIGSE
ncbi:MAG: SDR family NAD(P)-dependent oxidoreductase, partial [Proteobacteria bacterium]